MTHPYSIFLGIDIGTTAVKIAYSDAKTPQTHKTHKTHKTITTKYRETQAQIKGLPDGHSEQDVGKIMEAVEYLIGEMGVDLRGERWENLSNCHDFAIGVTGQMHGSLLWDPNLETKFRLAGPFINWQDKRCSDEFLEELKIKIGLGKNSRIYSGYGIASLAWLAENGENTTDKIEDRFCVGTIMDYAVEYLHGFPSKSGIKMTDQNAEAFGLLNTTSKLDKIEIVKSGERVGPCLNVLAPFGDHQCSIFAMMQGLNLDKSDQSSCTIFNLGTSAQVSILTVNDKKKPPIGWTKRPYFYDDTEVLVFASLNGGNVFEKLEFSDCRTENLSKLSALAENLPKTQNLDSPVFRTRFYGERHDSKVSPTLGEWKDICKNYEPSLVFKSMIIGLIDNLLENHPNRDGIKHMVFSGSVYEHNKRIIREYIGNIYPDVKVHDVDGNAAVGAMYAAEYYANQVI